MNEERIAEADRVDGPFAASRQQAALWALDHAGSGSLELNNVSATMLTGSLDVSVLERAFQAVVRRHEILRTFLLPGPSGLQQYVAHERGTRLLSESLEEIALADRNGRLEQLIDDERNTPFDLSASPMIRMRVVRLASGCHVMIRAVHHTAWDGASRGVFDRDLESLYEHFSGGKIDVREPPAQYREYAEWQRLAGVTPDAARYWERYLDGMAKTLVARMPEPRGSTSAHFTRLMLPADKYANTKRLASAYGVSVAVLLLALVGLTLARRSGQPACVVGVPIRNRPGLRFDGTIGLFSMMIPILVDPGEADTLAALARRVQGAILDVQDHPCADVYRLVDERFGQVGPIAALIPATFSAPGSPRRPFTFGGLSTKACATQPRRSHFGLQINLRDLPSGAELWCVARQSVYSLDAAESLLDEVDTCLERALEHPACAVRPS